jgi:glycosyltransferase involved in cell wall biosynthesis
MGRTGRALLSAVLLVALPVAASPFDDDNDIDVELLERRPAAAHHGSHHRPVHSDPESSLRVMHLDSGRQWRGGQAQAFMLMNGLARRGVESRLLAPPGPLLERARERDLEARSWEPRGDWDLAALARAAACCASWRPAVVHCHDARSHALGVPAARMAGVPAVVVSRRVAFRVRANPLSALKYRMPVDRYLCVSHAVADRLRGAGVPEHRLALVPDAVDVCAQPAPDLRALLGVCPETPLVGTVAALTPEKGHATLLEAAALVVRAAPRSHFVWMGEGKCREALLRRRAELGLEGHVHLLGHRVDATSLLGQCTICAQTSYEEGLGTSLLEAQALGVPVVATAVGGTIEIIQDDRNGRLVPPGDSAFLAAALIEALARPDLRRDWSDAGRSVAREFRPERMIERTLAEYRAVLRGARPANPVV